MHFEMQYAFQNAWNIFPQKKIIQQNVRAYLTKNFQTCNRKGFHVWLLCPYFVYVG